MSSSIKSTAEERIDRMMFAFALSDVRYRIGLLRWGRTSCCAADFVLVQGDVVVSNYLGMHVLYVCL